MQIINQYIVNGERKPIETEKVHGIATGPKRILFEAKFHGELRYYILNGDTPVEIDQEGAQYLITTAHPYFKTELITEK